MQRICTKCNKSLDIKYFEFRQDTNKLRNYCKKCNKGYASDRFDSKEEILNLLKDNKKKCSRCLEIKELEDFSKDKYTITGHCSYCKDCVRQKSILEKDITRNRRLKQKYNISLDLYNKLYNEQKGCCKICNNFYEVLNVDHCHNSSNFRGLLCFHCNSGLGMFKDNIDNLRAAIEYLEITK